MKGSYLRWPVRARLRTRRPPGPWVTTPPGPGVTTAARPLFPGRPTAPDRGRAVADVDPPGSEVAVQLVRVAPPEGLAVLGEPPGDLRRAGGGPVGVGQPAGHGAVLVRGQQNVPQREAEQMGEGRYGRAGRPYDQCPAADRPPDGGD